MPIIVNAGLSRKTSQDYQSKGYSLNIQHELPANIIDDPEAMSQAVSTIFRLAEDLLDVQIQTAQQSQPATDENQSHSSIPAKLSQNSPSKVPTRSFTRGGNTGNHATNNSTRTVSGGRGITEAQIKAITNMTNRLNEDPHQIARGEFGVELKELTIRQASGLIDSLKGRFQSQKAGAGA